MRTLGHVLLDTLELHLTESSSQCDQPQFSSILLDFDLCT